MHSWEITYFLFLKSILTYDRMHHFYVQIAYTSNLLISNCCNVCISHPRQLADTNFELLKILLKSLRSLDLTVLMDNKQKTTIH